MKDHTTINLTELYDVRLVEGSLYLYGVRGSSNSRYLVTLPLTVDWVRFLADVLGERVGQLATNLKDARTALLDAGQRAC